MDSGGGKGEDSSMPLLGGEGVFEAGASRLRDKLKTPLQCKIASLPLLAQTSSSSLYFF